MMTAKRTDIMIITDSAGDLAEERSLLHAIVAKVIAKMPRARMV